MGRSQRLTIDRGIYRDASGHEVVAKAGRLRRSKRFPLDASLETMRTWRDGTTTELREDAPPTFDTRTLRGAVSAYYVKTALPKDSPYRTALNAWLSLYGDLERRHLTPAKAQQAIERWMHDGYGGQSLYYRRKAIQKLWRALDGPKVKTPVDDVRVRRTRAKRPVWVPDETILAVLMELRRQEMAGRLRSAKTRARFLVLATTGQRPAQLKRARREDVDLPRGVWWVRAAKGGEPVPVYLNSEMRDAWEAFTRAKAWGWYDTRSFARTIRHAGWPAGVRIYNVRHATGFTLSARGADLGDIQLSLGHTDPSTTRVYVGAVDERMREVSARLEGRFRGK